MQGVAIFLVSIFLGYSLSSFVTYIYDSFPEAVEKYTTKKGYHVHHSMYGITTFLPVPIMINNHHMVTTLVLIGIGIGIIIEHTIQCGFVFLTKKGN